MKVLRSSVVRDVLMVVAGGLLLLEVLGSLAVGSLIWSALFGVAGLGFGYVFFRSRENWWAAIPAGALLGLAVLTAWGDSHLTPPMTGEGRCYWAHSGRASGPYYLRGRECWWAIIPGGTLLTLALVTGLSSTVGGMAISGVFFFGLALTFALLAALPTEAGRMRCPIIPAGVLVGIGAGGALSYVRPLALVLGGLYLILRTFGLGRRPKPHG